MIETRQFNLNGIKLEAGHITPRTRQFFESRGAKIEEVGDKLKISGAFCISRAETDAFLKRREDEDSRVVEKETQKYKMPMVIEVPQVPEANKMPKYDQRAPSEFLSPIKYIIFFKVFLEIPLKSLIFAAIMFGLFGCFNGVAASVFGVSLMKAAFISSESALIFAMLTTTLMTIFAANDALKLFHLWQYDKLQNAIASQCAFKQESTPGLKVEKDVKPFRVIHQKSSENLDSKLSPVHELGLFALTKSVSTTSATSTHCQGLGVTDEVPIFG